MKRKLIPHYPATPEIKNTAFYHASCPGFLLLLERLAGIYYSITFNYQFKDEVEGTTQVQVDTYSFTWSCSKISAGTAKHNCSLLKNTNARAELLFACLSTPEQVRAALSASLEDFTPSQHTSQPVGTTGRLPLAVDQYQQGQVTPRTPCGSVWHIEILRTCRMPGNVSSLLLKHSGLDSWAWSKLEHSTQIHCRHLSIADSHTTN